MPNKKIHSETSSVESQCRGLTRTFTDPVLHARLKEQERISMKKNSFQRSYSQSFSSIFSISISNSSDDDVFLANDQAYLLKTEQATSLSRTSFHTLSSSASIPKLFYISSFSSSEISEIDSDDYVPHRRYTL